MFVVDVVEKSKNIAVRDMRLHENGEIATVEGLERPIRVVSIQAQAIDGEGTQRNDVALYEPCNALLSMRCVMHTRRTRRERERESITSGQS